MRSRRRGQAIVEFGVIALLFTALMFAVVDFGLLLNTWLSVSANTREIARNASVGKPSAFLFAEAQHLAVPSVSATNFSKLCCDATSAVEVKVEYFTPGCPPWNGCAAIATGLIDSRYPAGDLSAGGGGGCLNPPGPCAEPKPDDLVRVTITAHGAQVITPLIRTAVGCTNGTNPNCYVPVATATTMRFEGFEF